MPVQFISLAQQGFGSGADDIQQAAQQALVNRQLREKMKADKAAAPAHTALLNAQANYYNDRTQSAEAIAKMKVDSAQQIAAEKLASAEEAKKTAASHALELQTQKDEAARLRGNDKIEAEAAIKKAELAQKALQDETTRKLAEAKIESERAKAALDLMTKIPTVKVGGQAYPATRDADGNVNLDTEGVDAVQSAQASKDQQAAMDAALAQKFVNGNGTGAPSKGIFRRALGAIGFETDPEIMQAAPEDKAAFGALLGNRNRALAAGVNPDAFAPYAGALGVQRPAVGPAGVPVHQPFAPSNPGPTNSRRGDSAALSGPPGAADPTITAPVSRIAPVARTVATEVRPDADIPSGTGAPTTPGAQGGGIGSMGAPVKQAVTVSQTGAKRFSERAIGETFWGQGRKWRKTGPNPQDREPVSEGDTQTQSSQDQNLAPVASGGAGG